MAEAQPPQPPLSGIHEAALYSDGLEGAERFWRRLGFEVIGRLEGRHVFFRAGDDVLLVFNREATRRAGGDVPPHGTAGPGHVAFDVPDLEALELWRRRLAEAGVEVERELEWRKGGRSLYFRDADGNSIEFITRGSWGF